MRIPHELEKLLDESGFPWSVEQGKKHAKVRLGGRFVAILPHGKIAGGSQRALLNTLAQVRRAIRDLQGIS